jgi:hypothetical protein
MKVHGMGFPQLTDEHVNGVNKNIERTIFLLLKNTFNGQSGNLLLL